MINPDRETSPVASALATAPRRRLLSHVIVGTLALILGAVGATAVLFATGTAGRQAHRFSVNIYLDHDVTAAQKSKIEAAIEALRPAGAVHFQTSSEAYAHMQDMAASAQTPLPSGLTPDSMPESYQFETTGSAFDCAPAMALLRMAGVDQIQILQQVSHGYGAVIRCQGMPPSGIGS